MEQTTLGLSPILFHKRDLIRPVITSIPLRGDWYGWRSPTRQTGFFLATKEERERTAVVETVRRLPNPRQQQNISNRLIRVPWSP